MEKKSIEIPSLTEEDFRKILPPNLIYPGLSELFGHYSLGYLKQIISKMNGYTWFRFVEAESKNLIFKKMATRILYRMLDREPLPSICAGNENGYLLSEKAVGLSSMGVNYKMINEDGIGIYEREGLLGLVVCDGVGDCLVGEVASFVILCELQEWPEKSIPRILNDSVESLISLGDRLVQEIPEFVTFPNEVSQAAVTVASIREDLCEVSQVGDVLLYHFRDGQIRFLNQNRQWLDLEDLNKLFSDDRYLAQRHIISNAIGRNYDPYWSTTRLDLEKGDILILASDGLETLHPREVLDIVIHEDDLQVMLDKLYQAVIETNLRWNTMAAPPYTKPDNISIILYRHE